MGIVEELEESPSLTDALRARERELLRELSVAVDGADAARIHSWLLRLGLVENAGPVQLQDSPAAFRFIERALSAPAAQGAAREAAGASAGAIPAAGGHGSAEGVHTNGARALRAHLQVALARLGAADADELSPLICDGSLAGSRALRLINEHDIALGEQAAQALAHNLAHELLQQAPRPRLELADALHLPVSARMLGKLAGPLLRVLVEDETLRPFFADGAARLWLELDIDDALPAALGVASEVNTMTLLALLATVDREEAYELLAARFERDPFLAELLMRTKSPLIQGDDRWIAHALARLQTDPPTMTRLLARIGTPRAVDELIGFIEHAQAVDAVVVGAIVALDEIHDGRALPEAFARALDIPDAPARLLHGAAQNEMHRIFARRCAAIRDVIAPGSAADALLARLIVSPWQRRRQPT